MTTEATIYFGFETLSKLAENDVHKKEDIIILFTHWFLVKTGFKCIGLGDAKTVEPNTEGTELLPPGWSDSDHYALRYLKESKLYILLGRKSDADLLLNFLTATDNCLSTVKFPVNATVLALRGPLPALIQDHPEVLKKIQKELVEPVCTGSAKETSTQTTETRSEERRRNSPLDDPLRDPLAVGPRRIPPARPWNPEEDPRGVGRRDLDPFAGIGPRGGGMIFDPLRPGRGFGDPLGPMPGGLGGPARLPPGAIIPGARFDPFGPPDVVQPRPHPRNPDPDHDLPPSGYDDMFM